MSKKNKIDWMLVILIMMATIAFISFILFEILFTGPGPIAK